MTATYFLIAIIAKSIVYTREKVNMEVEEEHSPPQSGAGKTVVLVLVFIIF